LLLVLNIGAEWCGIGIHVLDMDPIDISFWECCGCPHKTKQNVLALYLSSALSLLVESS
jgi:hypothetical protein